MEDSLELRGLGHRSLCRPTRDACDLHKENSCALSVELFFYIYNLHLLIVFYYPSVKRL